MNRKIVRLSYVLIIMAASVVLFVRAAGSEVAEPPGAPTTAKEEKEKKIGLPKPKQKGAVSLEETIERRRSRRTFEDKALSKEQLSQILWAAQGITDGKRYRAAPSAGATYPLDIYVVIVENGCEGVPAGVYRYMPSEHVMVLRTEGDKRKALSAVLMAQAPVTIVVTAEYSRTTAKYGERGRMYVHMEVGHVGQNVYLQAEALGLGTCAVGAFNTPKVSTLLDLPKEHEPLYMLPVGHPG